MLLSAAEGAGLARDRLRLALEADLPLVRADGAQLERAFANLLENARRFSGDHPVAVRARADGDRLTVRVVDRGPGIPHARLRHFEPFWRAPGEHGGGAGLGLAIVRGFVEANGRAGVGRVAARPGVDLRRRAGAGAAPGRRLTRWMMLTRAVRGARASTTSPTPGRRPARSAAPPRGRPTGPPGRLWPPPRMTARASTDSGFGRDQRRRR